MPFHFDRSLNNLLLDFDETIRETWAGEEMTPQDLLDIYQQTKIDELYHSNRIEGNTLTFGETVEVVQANKEIAGKPFRDQQEARNLSAVLDFAHSIGVDSSVNVTQNELRRIHALLLDGIQADAGTYRKTPIEITGSRFAPPEAFQVPQFMTALSDYVMRVADPIEHCEETPIFSAAAAHAWLAQIHPCTDGNGRAARTLMNLILMRRGYPPCIITVDDRPRYIDALEVSWEDGNLTSLMELILENVNEQRKNRDWLREVQARLEQAVSQEVESEYLIWRNAMSYLKSQFRHTVDNINATAMQDRVRLRFADYGELDAAKYDALRRGHSVTKTGYFGIEVGGPAQRQLFVFFHGVAAETLRERAPAALMIMSGMQPDDMQMDKATSAPMPNIFQVGFDQAARTFLISDTKGLYESNPQKLVKRFFDEILPSGLEA